MSKKVPKLEVPLSETLIQKLANGTLDECVNNLRAIAKANPANDISRNFYRVHGLYSESTWNVYFGTFAEFKRQAG